MAERIALETYAANIGGGSGAVSKKCCTKTRAETLGCQVSGSYAAKRLVPRTALSKANITFRIILEDYTTCLNIDIARFNHEDLENAPTFEESQWSTSANLEWQASLINYPSEYPYTIKWYLRTVGGLVSSDGVHTVDYNNQDDVNGEAFTIRLSDLFTDTPTDVHLIFEDA